MIEEYINARKVSNKLIKSMNEYENNNYEYLENRINKLDDILDEIECLLPLDLSFNRIGNEILMDFKIFPQIPTVPNLTDTFINLKKVRNKDKQKMLNTFKNSYISLFKLIRVDSENNFVIYKDLYNNKEYKVFDISFSNTYSNGLKDYYTYDRMFTYNNINFLMGYNLIFLGKNKKLLNYINDKKYLNKSNIEKTIDLYYIYNNKLNYQNNKNN